MLGTTAAFWNILEIRKSRMNPSKVVGLVSCVKRKFSSPVGVGDQRQAAVVPRNLPQDGKDEQQHLNTEEEAGGLQ